MLTHIKRGLMGTAEFDGLFKPQRQAQNFVVYPLHAGNPTDRIKVQSDKRIGYIDLSTGAVSLSPSRAGGSYNTHLHLATPVGTLGAEELLLLKAQVFATAHGDAGRSINRVIGTDNSGAIDVFGATA